uniref:Uncharacterized protein n=1 Tax=Romanomermis culicivorax TaxID=13658 RepID=A0A915KG03_ROMCU
MYDCISADHDIAPVPMDESTPIQSATMDTETTTTTDQACNGTCRRPANLFGHSGNSSRTSDHSHRCGCQV